MKENVLKKIKGVVLLSKEESKTISGGYGGGGIPINTCGYSPCIAKFYSVGQCGSLKIYRVTVAFNGGYTFCVGS